MAPAEIRAFRHRHKLTQGQLAELLGLADPARGGQVTVARWEHGNREPAPYLKLALREVERQLEEREIRSVLPSSPASEPG